MAAHVYRLYSEDGALLYIGSSINVPLRLKQLRKVQPWANEIARVEIGEGFENRTAAFVAEAQAIDIEQPRENKANWKQWRTHPDLDEFCRIRERTTGLFRAMRRRQADAA